MMKYKISNMLGDHHDLHSEFQIENFIIKSQGDEWAQYKQCLREIKARVENIESDKIQLKILELNKTKKPPFWFKIFKHKIIKIEGATGSDKLTSLKNTIKERERELECFVRIAEKLKDKLGDITAERRAQLEAESWKAKGLKMAALDLMSAGRISGQTLDFIFSLPKGSQLELFSKLSAKQPMALLGFEPDEIRAISKK